MTVKERVFALSTIAGATGLGAYWVTILIRAAGDGLPFAEVAWQGPLLLVLALGCTFYVATWAVLNVRARGEQASDLRDAHIRRYSDAAGAGLTSLTVAAALVMLALNVAPFWVASVLLTGAVSGAIIAGSAALAAYREGIPA